MSPLNNNTLTSPSSVPSSAAPLNQLPSPSPIPATSTSSPTAGVAGSGVSTSNMASGIYLQRQMTTQHSVLL